MFVKIVTIAAFCGVALLIVILVQAKLQQRKAERALVELDQLHVRNVAAKEARDLKVQDEKAALDTASADLRAAVIEANAILDERLRETKDLFVKKRILNDKLKLLEMQRPGSEGHPTESMVALAEDFRAKAEEVRRLAKRF